jgi:hypothetical protein
MLFTPSLSVLLALLSHCLFYSLLCPSAPQNILDSSCIFPASTLGSDSFQGAMVAFIREQCVERFSWFFGAKGIIITIIYKCPSNYILSSLKYFHVTLGEKYYIFISAYL